MMRHALSLIYKMLCAFILGFGDGSITKLLDQFGCYISDADMVKVEWPLPRSPLKCKYNSDTTVL